MTWLLVLAACYTAYFSHGVYYYNRHEAFFNRIIIVLITNIAPAIVWLAAGYSVGVSHA